MMGYGGRERTLREYADLFERAGLTLHQAAPAPSGFSILEGFAAQSGPEKPPVRERSAETTDRESV
jgi:hypothetical protein